MLRILSFIVFIIGCILCFSEAAKGFGIFLMILGFLMNVLSHIIKYYEEKYK